MPVGTDTVRAWHKVTRAFPCFLEQLHAAQPVMADAALHLPAQEGSVVALGVQGLAADGPLFFGIEEEEVGRITGLNLVVISISL